MKKHRIILYAAVLVLCVWGLGHREPPEPEQCALCEAGWAYHAPCVMNVATGEITELVSDWPEGPDGQEIQVFRLADSGKIGLDICRRADFQSCTAYLSEWEPMDRSLDCSKPARLERAASRPRGR